MAVGKSAGSIFVDMLLNTVGYSDGLRKTSQQTNRWSNQQKTYFNATAASADAVTSAIVRIGSIAAGALSVQKIIQYSDTFKGLQSRLSLVTDSSADLADTTQKLFDISQRNQQPFEDTIDAYTRLNNSLNASQKASTDLIKFTDLLAKTLLISGTNAAGAATFFQQFGQAASSDFKAIGQELQTFADQNPRFYAILRDEATKYGKTLKQMASDGELSFDFVAKAVLNASESIEGDASRISGTVGKAITQLNNSFLLFIGQSQDVAAASNIIAESIQGLADGFAEANKNALDLTAVLVGVGAQALDIAKRFDEAKLVIYEALHLPDVFINRQKALIDDYNKKIDSIGENLLNRQEQLRESLQAPQGFTAPEPEQVVKPVSLEPAKQQVKIQRELQSLYDRNEDLIRGVDQATLNYERTIADLNTLLNNGKISQDEFNRAVAGAGEEFDKARDKGNVWAFDIEAASKRAAENIQDNLADFLFDPFDKGLDGMVLGFVNTLRRMAAEAAAAQLLSKLFGDDGGIFSKFAKSVFGSSSGSGASSNLNLGSVNLPKFADGGFIEPGQWGIAGEAGAELLYGGRQGVTVIPEKKMGSSANTYNIDARGADQGAIRRLEQALLALAGPGQIEMRVADAQQRGAL